MFGVGIIIVLGNILAIRSRGFRLSANTATRGDSFVDGSAVEKAFNRGKEAHGEMRVRGLCFKIGSSACPLVMSRAKFGI